MKEVVKHIPALLKANECAIIPEFGGFLINDKPAWFSEETKRFFPPASQIVFNKNLNSNDGLLAQAVATDNEISYSAANKKIAEYVAWANDFLKENKSIIIPDIGKIYIDSADNQQFVQLNSDNFRKESFGLPQLSATQLEKEELVVAPIIPITKNESKKSWLSNIAATAAILVTLGLFFVLNDSNITTNNQTAGIGLPAAKKEASVKAEPIVAVEPVDPFAEPTDTEDIFETPAITNESVIVEPAVVIEPQKVELPATPIQLNNSLITQHVVVGMFTEKINADKMYVKSRNAGFSPQLISGRKYNRVVIPVTGERAQIKSQLRQIKNTLEPGAWIWETR